MRPALFALVLAAAIGPPQEATLNPCTIEGQPSRCGRITVSERHDRPDGRRIALNVRVLLRTGSGARRAPIFFLAGGPGTAANRYAAFVQQIFQSVRGDRDLVLVDQRGTGESNGLDCAVAPRTFVEPLDPARCLARLSRQADLTAYGTDAFVRDLDLVREQLGYEQIVVAGGSYGTRASYVYARAFPQRVEAVILFAPAPLSMSVLDNMERDGGAVIAARLAEAPAEIRAAASRFDFAADPYYAIGLRFLAYEATTARTIPHLLREAASGNTAPLDRAIEAFREYLASETDLGLHLSVMCSEELPFAKEASRARAEYERACRGWPRAAPPADIRTMTRLPHRALVMAGERDPVTGPKWGRLFADAFSPGTLVVIPGAGHMTASTSCFDALASSFLAGALDTACVQR